MDGGELVENGDLKIQKTVYMVKYFIAETDLVLEIFPRCASNFLDKIYQNSKEHERGDLTKNSDFEEGTCVYMVPKVEFRKMSDPLVCINLYTFRGYIVRTWVWFSGCNLNVLRCFWENYNMFVHKLISILLLISNLVIVLKKNITY